GLAGERADDVVARARAAERDENRAVARLGVAVDVEGRARAEGRLEGAARDHDLVGPDAGEAEDVARVDDDSPGLVRDVRRDGEPEVVGRRLPLPGLRRGHLDRVDVGPVEREAVAVAVAEDDAEGLRVEERAHAPVRLALAPREELVRRDA